METDEIKRSYSIRKLGIEDRIKTFDCGDDDLNDFIINESFLYRKALLAISYALENNDLKQTVGYFSLANDKVSVTDFQDKTEFNRFRKQKFVNEKRLKSYPAAKICRLGIDDSMRNQSLGTFIIDFIKSYFVINNKTGCRFLTVDAYRDAIPFYLKNGFVPLSEDDKMSYTRLLYFDLNDIV